MIRGPDESRSIRGRSAVAFLSIRQFFDRLRDTVVEHRDIERIVCPLALEFVQLGVIAQIGYDSSSFNQVALEQLGQSLRVSRFHDF